MNRSGRLSLRLLGGVALERDARPLHLTYEKGRALIAYLATESGRAHSRETLAAMFWPDLARDAALSNLRQVLHNLRQVLDPSDRATPALQIDRESIRLHPAANLEVDAAAFCVPACACPAVLSTDHCDPCRAQMEILAARYVGPFMAAFSLPNCPDFEEWLQVQREALHMRALALLLRLSECHERTGAYDKSLPFALRFLELEPWNEDGLRRAMRLRALNGQRAMALDQYEAGCRTLKRDLGVLPSEPTHALAEQIRRGELPPARSPVPDVFATAPLPQPVAERRQVTVLYCELAAVGVEDPDAALALLRAPQVRCNEIIRGYSGYPVQVHGGGLLAYFGYPQAGENAARQAVQAALSLTRAAFPGLEQRVGVHTGVVISSGDSHVPDAIGATSGLAIRLRQLADCGEAVISDATQRLVAGFFECVPRGLEQLVPGARALQVFRVGPESGARHRLEAAAKLTPLVGRKNEIATLFAAYQDARRGTRNVVLVRGEAGVGKSRLLLALVDALRGQTYVMRELRCLPEYSQSPFHPLVALFGFTLGFALDDTLEARFDKLAAYVEIHYPKTDPETVPLLAEMLSLPLRLPYRKPASAPQHQRAKTLALMLERLHALTAQHLVLLVVEDLHWADPSTLELLNLFVTAERPAPILAVFTARPEFRSPWAESLVRPLPVKALDHADTTVLIGAVAPQLAPAAVRRIVERADGIPLFAEELAIEAAANDQLAIPSSLQDLLAERLDNAGAAKGAAQAASVLGREFSVDLLRRISPFDDATLTRLLRQLQDAGLLQSAASGMFQFKHALIRDAAYQSQTRPEREAAHCRIAAALAAAGAETRPELLALHWSAGGKVREAIACWIKAGKLASQHSASHEAVVHFKSGLALVETLPAGPDTVRLELDLQIGLGAAACAAQGYASAEGAAAYTRAIDICGQGESSPDMFPAVWGLWGSASSRTGYVHAFELAQQLLRMANESGDPVQDQQGHFAVADTLYWQGEFAAARDHLDRIRSVYHSCHHASHVAGFGEDAGVTSGSYRSWVLWFLGFPDQARVVSEQTIALARQLGHPYSLAYALTFATLLCCRLRQPEQALTLAQETLNLANHHGFSLWQIGAMLSRGWALAMQNRSEGVEAILQCVAATRAAMGGVSLVVLEPLVDANVVLGRYDAALAVGEEAFAIGSALGDHHIEAELHRLKGESLSGLADADDAQAETCFQQALAVARRQQAKSLELRAALSLARLWQRQGRRDDARRLLEAVYGWFSEGFGTPDLQDARAFLGDGTP